MSPLQHQLVIDKLVWKVHTCRLNQVTFRNCASEASLKEVVHSYVRVFTFGLTARLTVPERQFLYTRPNHSNRLRGSWKRALVTIDHHHCLAAVLISLILCNEQCGAEFNELRVSCQHADQVRCGHANLQRIQHLCQCNIPLAVS